MTDQKRRVRVSAGELATLDAGDPEAPAVVLLSGGFTSSHVWRHVVPMLVPWTRVIAPDLLGSGDSESRPGTDLGLPAHARAVRELLGELGVERFALAGHGHGGGVAQLVAFEGGVAGLVLVDSIAFDAWPAPAVRALREDLARGARPDPDGWIHAMLDRGISRRERLSDADVAEYLRPFAGEDGADRFARVAASFDGEGLAGSETHLADLDVPAFVLWGEDDAFVPVSVAERLGDALPRASVAVLPGCGHFLLEDAPDTVAPLLFEWFRRSFLGMEHRHETAGPVAVSLGRRPPGEEEYWRDRATGGG